ncbi:Det1 complexing ubiquitin ligase [Nesidiocoris tenuis]|uniref:DET1- and DDB1-associated protein 1 n=1 Tax=Nesidiocoris tenuis TaxID=355587 RepID=A0ABN7AGQ8_9HEMI|nr:Det1 complexing ubiquitin ligase [Nesidiocoris tenuis]
MSVISEFLNGLPSYDSENFSKYANSQGRSQTKKPPVHIPTTDSPVDQVIVPERTNVLLRYLHQKWEKEQPGLKRNNESDPLAFSLKRPRLDNSDESS